MPINIKDRAQNIIMTPDTEWGVIEAEPTTVVDIYREYILILAAIPPVARFLRGLMFGYHVGPGPNVHFGAFSGLLGAIAAYVFSLVMIYVISLAVSYLAPNFGGVRDDLQAFKLTAYAYTPAWLAGVFTLIPGLGFLGVLGLYGLYLFYLGAPRFVKVPRERAMAFTAVIVVVTIVLGFIAGGLAYMLSPGPGSAMP